MKKILFILLFLFSCSKEDDNQPAPTSCYHCVQTIVTRVTVYVPGYPKTEHNYYDFCGWYATDAAAFEKKNTVTSTVSSGSAKVISTSTCKCTIK